MMDKHKVSWQSRTMKTRNGTEHLKKHSRIVLMKDGR